MCHVGKIIFKVHSRVKLHSEKCVAHFCNFNLPEIDSGFNANKHCVENTLRLQSPAKHWADLLIKDNNLLGFWGF